MCVERTNRSKVPKATMSPTLRDLAWAAGFMEGEGTFSSDDKTGKGGRARAVQVNPEPLLRIAAMFGGHVKVSHCVAGNRKPIHYWQVNGARARGVMQTLFSMMSAKRQGQIMVALGEAKIAGRPDTA